MTAEDPPSAERFSLSRWSRRKHDAARTAQQEPAAAAAPAAPGSVAPATAAPAVAANAPAPAPLPPVESLTFDSDFAPFVQPKVDESTRRAALRKLFADPHFNAMDGLDVYVDDYTKSDPLPAGMLDQLARVYDAIAGDDKSAAAKDAGTTSEPVAATPESAPPESAPAQSASEPAQLADESAAAAAPVTPTPSSHAGRGGIADKSS